MDERETNFEDKPLPKGSYNLDNLEELEAQMMMNNPPKNAAVKKDPPAKQLAKKKTSEEK